MRSWKIFSFTRALTLRYAGVIDGGGVFTLVFQSQ